MRGADRYEGKLCGSQGGRDVMGARRDNEHSSCKRDIGMLGKMDRQLPRALKGAKAVLPLYPARAAPCPQGALKKWPANDRP